VKRGLKLTSPLSAEMPSLSYNADPGEEGIETELSAHTARHPWQVITLIPVKRGLKHEVHERMQNTVYHVITLIPVKRGLKRGIHLKAPRCFLKVITLIPVKRGLKLKAPFTYEVVRWVSYNADPGEEGIETRKAGDQENCTDNTSAVKREEKRIEEAMFMCRMLGFISREPILISRYLWEAPRSLQWLSLHGQKAPHRDGLGLTYKDADKGMKLYKWGREELTQLKEKGFPKISDAKTTLLIAHSRKASEAYKQMTTAAQAHPLFEDGIYLAHNGTIRDAHKLRAREGTDSQKLIHWLAHNWRPRNPSGLQEALQKLLTLVKGYTAINLLLTEGSHLYAFCCYSREPEYYTLHYHLDEKIVIVASEPLDEGLRWQPLACGELLQIAPNLELRKTRIARARAGRENIIAKRQISSRPALLDATALSLASLPS